MGRCTPQGVFSIFLPGQGASATAPKTVELKALNAARSGRATSELMEQVKRAALNPFGSAIFHSRTAFIQDGHTLGAIGAAAHDGQGGAAP
jgi:hypothetical protein